MHPALAVVLIAQQLLPAGPLVHGGRADLREPRIAIGVHATDLLADSLVARPGGALPDNEEAESDLQGVVELGVNLPLVRLGAIVLSLQGGAISRFRLERSDNDAFSVDYMIALPLNYVRGATEARLRVIHRSAHLGDELVQNSTIRRLEYDHEEVDALFARRLGPIRVYAMGTLTLASSFEEDKWGVGAGVEGRRGVGTNVAIVVAIDWQRHSIANEKSRLAGMAGLELSGPAGRMALEGTYSAGASALGEFFLERERFLGLRLVLMPIKL